MLDELEPFGKVVGADFSKEALDFCRKRGARSNKEYGLVRADIRSLPFADDSFDIVSAMDIIEHIDQDKVALTEISRVLKPRGRLLATVPAYMFLWSEHDVALQHHRRYTARSFRDVVQRAGLQMEHMSYTVTSLLPLIALIRRAERLTNDMSRPPQADLVPVPALINQALVALMGLETQIVRRGSLPFGVTVVAVARKASK